MNTKKILLGAAVLAAVVFLWRRQSANAQAVSTPTGTSGQRSGGSGGGGGGGYSGGGSQGDQTTSVIWTPPPPGTQPVSNKTSANAPNVHPPSGGQFSK